MSRAGLHAGDWVLVTSPARPDALSTDGLSTIAIMRAMATMGVHAVLYAVQRGAKELLVSQLDDNVFHYEGSPQTRQTDLREIAQRHVAKHPPEHWNGPFKAVFVTGPLTADRLLPDIDAVFGEELPRIANFYCSVEQRLARDERPIESAQAVLLPKPFNWSDQLYALLAFDQVLVDREDEEKRLRRELADLLLRSGLTSHRIIRTQLRLRRLDNLPSDAGLLAGMLPINAIPMPSPQEIRE